MSNFSSRLAFSLLLERLSPQESVMQMCAFIFISRSVNPRSCEGEIGFRYEGNVDSFCVRGEGGTIRFLAFLLRCPGEAVCVWARWGVRLPA